MNVKFYGTIKAFAQIHYTKTCASGGMATYETSSNNAGITYLTEQNLYGSSRLGKFNPYTDVSDATGLKLSWSTANKKEYELNNHLGNVLAVISGDYYVNSGSEKEAIVNSAQDYYAFGMLQPGRTYKAPNQAS